MDIREAIEDSFDHHESMADRELEAETPDTAADDAEEDYSAEVAGDDPVDEDGDAGDAPAEEEDRPAPNDAPKKKQKEEKLDAAPGGWEPGAREKWKTLPIDVRRNIKRVEVEVAKMVQETSSARRLAAEISSVMTPHMDGLVADGFATPAQFISEAVQIRKALREGSAQEKAKVIADLVDQFGVDLGALDETIAGRIKSNPNRDIERMIEERIRTVTQHFAALQYQQQAAAHAQQAKVAAHVDEFSRANEFTKLPGFRSLMADILDSAARIGRGMTLQEAYDQAASIHPEAARIKQEHERSEAIKASMQKIGKKRAAAGASLTGRMGPPPPEQVPDDTRDLIRQIMG